VPRARPTCGRPSPSSIRRRSMLSQWRDGAILWDAYLSHGADAKRRTDNGPDSLGRTIVAGRETLKDDFADCSERRRRRGRVENDRPMNRRTFTVGIGALVTGACARQAHASTVSTGHARSVRGTCPRGRALHGNGDLHLGRRDFLGLVVGAALKALTMSHGPDRSGFTPRRNDSLRAQAVRRVASDVATFSL